MFCSCGWPSLSCLTTSDITESTVQVSWLQLLNTLTNIIICSLWSFPLLMATVPGSPMFRKPIRLALSKLSWKELHNPVWTKKTEVLSSTFIMFNLEKNMLSSLCIAIFHQVSSATTLPVLCRDTCFLSVTLLSSEWILNLNNFVLSLTRQVISCLLCILPCAQSNTGPT